MPSERHIRRQIEWSDKLRQYGAIVELEKRIRIKRAKVVVDVYAEAEGKVFLIEIGNIDDEQKHHSNTGEGATFWHDDHGRYRRM